MGWTSYGLLTFLLVVILTVSVFGAYAGYTVAGVPQGGGLSGENPGLFGIVEFVWDSIGFIIHMSTFQVDNLPPAFNAVFLLMGLLSVFIVVKLIRGS